jgi:ABC-type molybdate transport system ATPase subunit
MTPFIELKNYTLGASLYGARLKPFDFQLMAEDICAIETDAPEDAHQLLSALATLTLPAGGDYFFNGQRLDFSDYRRLLPYKKKIAYIAPDAALISNRNIRENLLLMRYYYENDLFIDLDPATMELCRVLGVENKLAMLPSALHLLDAQRVITIRELTKPPELILMERPEDFIWQADFHQLHPKLKRLLINDDAPIVFFSFDRDFVNEFATRVIAIRGGEVKTRTVE